MTNQTHHPRSTPPPTRSPARWFALACLATGLVAARPAAAIVFINAAAQSAGLGAGQSFLDAEALLTISTGTGSSEGCSGSLLAGGQYVLTAAHCVSGGGITNITVDFANAGLTASASSYIVDPQWNGSVYNGGDLALIVMGTPVTAITGYQVDTASSAAGDIVTLAGYGDTGTGSTGYVPYSTGTLYYGQNAYDTVSPDVPIAYEFNFSADGGAVGSQEAMIAPGDSGGASLINLNGTWAIVGVHEFIGCNATGCTPDSGFGNIGGDTPVYTNAAWLDPYLAPEPGTGFVLGSGLLGLFGAARRRKGARSRP